MAARREKIPRDFRVPPSNYLSFDFLCFIFFYFAELTPSVYGAGTGERKREANRVGWKRKKDSLDALY